ncbi:MAG TPA: GNAT family N-acetyltransferase [bacterium]|jgi:GNAT superfamily N-acetyltransferase
MLLNIRDASPQDVDFLVGTYEWAYRGGYSACFDRYGVIGPQDFWWVQAEKSVSVIEIDRSSAGLLIIGKDRRQLLVEELLVAGDGHAGRADRESGMLIPRLYGQLVEHFKRGRQDRILLRAAERNTVALDLAHRHQFTFVNALVVSAGAAAARPSIPEGYAIRRATADDERVVARLSDELLGESFASSRRPSPRRKRVGDVRTFLAERDRYVTGVALTHVEAGTGLWAVAVREAHRRKRIGAALAGAALQYLQHLGVKPVATYWALDPGAARLAQRLGATTERTYLYLQKSI